MPTQASLHLWCGRFRFWKKLVTQFYDLRIGALNFRLVFSSQIPEGICTWHWLSSTVSGNGTIDKRLCGCKLFVFWIRSLQEFDDFCRRKSGKLPLVEICPVQPQIDDLVSKGKSKIFTLRHLQFFHLLDLDFFWRRQSSLALCNDENAVFVAAWLWIF